MTGYIEKIENEAVGGGEAWRKELDRLILTRKMDVAASAIAFASSYPTEENVKRAYGGINDILLFIPIGASPTALKARNAAVEKMKDIRSVLFGDRNSTENMKLMCEWNVTFSIQRNGPYMISRLANIPTLVEKLQDVYFLINDMAVTHGLRIVVSEPKAKGFNKIMDEEGMEEMADVG